MAKNKTVYKSYLLRLWCDEANGRYRIRLEEVNKEPQVLHFTDVENLLGYLLPPFPAQADQNTPPRRTAIEPKKIQLEQDC